MNGIHHILLNGKKESLRFNNYARAELRKFFMKPNEVMLTETQLTNRIIKKFRENDVVLIKMIVYAGIVGDSLVSGFESRLTSTQVGEYIGEAAPDEIFAIWRAFLDAQGINLNNEEATGTQKKKRKTAGK